MDGGVVAKLLQNIGGEVVCPKCGEVGRVAVDRFRSRGHTYYYLVVRHPRGRSRVKRCLVKRLTRDEAAKLVAKQQAVAKTVAKQEGFAAQEGIAKLKRRIEELERENEELRRQLERLQTVEGWIRAARQNSLILDRQRLEAIRIYYVKKKGYTPEQKDLAKTVMTELIDRGLETGQITIIFGRLP